ncbi:MAG: hypothetical protein IJJ48_02280 [Firmicutes bacterium]|nr:hypothetical protein [Bacillota bacterium]
MFKALLKKQFRELALTYSTGRRGGSGAGSRKALSGKWVILVWLLCLVSFGMAFFASAEMFAGVIFPLKLDWIYFAYLGMASIALGIFGSIFGVVSGIYKARDNELLLSMPIPPRLIVLARMISLWVIAFVCVLAGIIPAACVYANYHETGALNIVSWILAAFTLSFAAFAFSCLVGWIVAIISKRLQNKSIITVLLALVFIAAYYVFYANVNQFLVRLATEAETIGDNIRRMVYPLYAYGRGAAGEILYALLALAMSLVLMGIIYLFISRSFTSVATSNKGIKKKAYSGKVGAESSIQRALLRKEFKRYLSSANYMLNSSMGTFLMPIAAIALVIKADAVRELLTSLGLPMEIFTRFLVLGLGYAVMFISTMNCLTAPSISLEGKNYWVIRSLPVDVKKLAKAKLYLHFILTGVPMILIIAAVVYAFRLDILSTLLISLMPVSYMMLQAYGGLAANIRFPRMDWVNEMVAVKQGASVAITVLGGMVLVMGLGALYFLVLMSIVDPTVFLLAQSGVFILLALLLRGWIMKKGTKILESLPC